jgi:hypothetical protein
MEQWAVEEVAGCGFPGCSISRTKRDVELISPQARARTGAQRLGNLRDRDSEDRGRISSIIGGPKRSRESRRIAARESHSANPSAAFYD